jgi:lipopolysaccharide export system protein LptA
MDAAPERPMRRILLVLLALTLAWGLAPARGVMPEAAALEDAPDEAPRDAASEDAELEDTEATDAEPTDAEPRDADAPDAETPDTEPTDAETRERRIITIDYSGGTASGNLRFGPITYTHPDPDGVVATVSTLTIESGRAVLRAPEQTLIAQAQGRREAEFEGGVTVRRGRLVAVGERLVYSEATGLGVLEGTAEVRIAPAREGEDEVLITAAIVTFDVDTDTSVSEGDVRLVNGNQTATAERLLFEEARDLGKLTSEGSQAEVTRAGDDGDLRIVADEIRVLTEFGALYAQGDVTVEDGPVTSRGDVVFYDDDEEIAEVIGSPATAIDTSSGVNLSTDRIRQDVRYRFVEAIDASLPTTYTAEQFALSSEHALP